MLRLFNNLHPFYSPDDSSGSGDDNLETLELLNAEDEPEETLDITPRTSRKSSETTEDTEETTGDEDEVDELKEIEEELEGPKEEDLELTTPVRRKEILKKYPTLFKDFPYLEKAYYREQQFTEVFPTVNDAKVAVEKARILDGVEGQVMSGDISTLLAAAKQESQEAFYKIADNYLPALRKVDQQAYYHVLGNVIKDTIVTMVKEGRQLGEQGAPLTAAANILNQFVFGSQTFTPPQGLSRPVPQEEQRRQQQIKQEEQSRFYGAFESTRTELQTKADNVLKSTISQHIDPKETMTDYVKGHAVNEAHEILENLISKDTRFRGLLDRLWEKAYEQKFSKESTDRIKSAYLSKAKTLLPSVIKTARNNALKGLGKRADSEDTIDLTPSVKKGPIANNGRSTAPSSGKIKSAKDIPRGMSTLDVLMSD
jgi:hypothetical protein